MIQVTQWISVLAIPVFIIFVLGYGAVKGVPVYETFVEGAGEGIRTAFHILPYLGAMFVAIGVFRGGHGFPDPDSFPGHQPGGDPS